MITAVEEWVLLDCWLYTSRRTAASESAQSVQDIVAESRSRNADLGVTGALICTGSLFAQFIEGPAGSIAALKRGILRDPRHTDVLTVAMEPQQDRRFAEWSLAYAGDALEFDHLIAVARTMRGTPGQELLFEMIRRFAAEPSD